MQAGTETLTTLNNGWTMTAENETGDFGTNYGLRTVIAASGYLMLKAPNAIYPTWSNGSAESSVQGGLFSVNADESLLCTFSGKPPLSQTGFWSLTAYNAENYLIPNDRNVYALGDRSNITYPNGARVYGSNASSSADGAFQILLQAADVAPPANWTTNWLPSPSGGGNVSALLRWYGAQEPLLDGSYLYPVVTRQAAMRGNSSGNGTSSSGAPPVTQTGGSGALCTVSSLLYFAVGWAVAVIVLA